VLLLLLLLLTDAVLLMIATGSTVAILASAEYIFESS
jgi:hypothetical protein